MLLPLALKNLLRTGLRTWLNVMVLSVAFVSIILMQGFNQGLIDQASRSMIETELGNGQIWHQNYDPYDPFTLRSAHGKISQPLNQLIQKDLATPVLIVPGTIYPEGRVVSINIRGIDPQQKIVNLPTGVLQHNNGEIPALIGTRMAQTAGLKKGDLTTLRWRDVNGTFDARDIEIVEVMSTPVQTVDNGQIWMPLEELRQMAALPGEATLMILGNNVAPPDLGSDWEFKSLDVLLKDIRDLVRIRRIGAAILYLILLLLGLIAVFDTQVLSVFRRRREIGTLIAMGMTRKKVMQLFTLEGTLNGVLAIIGGTIYGAPVFYYLTVAGVDLPQSTEGMGLAIGNVLYPVFGSQLIIGTIFLVLVAVAIVSFWPVRRISMMKPTDAIRGKLP